VKLKSLLISAILIISATVSIHGVEDSPFYPVIGFIKYQNGMEVWYATQLYILKIWTEE